MLDSPVNIQFIKVLTFTLCDSDKARYCSSKSSSVVLTGSSEPPRSKNGFRVMSDPSPSGIILLRKHVEPLTKHQKSLIFVVESVANSDVNHLERIATALYVSSENICSEIEKLAQEIVDLKPHISREDATTAITVKTLKTKALECELEVR